MGFEVKRKISWWPSPVHVHHIDGLTALSVEICKKWSTCLPAAARGIASLPSTLLALPVARFAFREQDMLHAAT